MLVILQVDSPFYMFPYILVLNVDNHQIYLGLLNLYDLLNLDQHVCD